MKITQLHGRGLMAFTPLVLLVTSLSGNRDKERRERKRGRMG